MKRNRIIGLVVVIAITISVLFFISMDLPSIDQGSDSGDISEIGISYDIEETGDSQYVVNLSEKVDEIRIYTEDSETPISKDNSSSVQLNTKSSVELKIFEDGKEYDVQTVG